MRHHWSSSAYIPMRLHVALLSMALLLTIGWLLMYAQWTAVSVRPFRRDSDSENGRNAITSARRLLERGREILRSGGAPYPEEIFQVDWAAHAPREDAVHLRRLQRACTSHRNSLITRDAVLDRYSSHSDAVLRVLRQCTAVDIYLPEDIRGQGYCEDAAAYVMHLHARMLPHWVFELEVVDRSRNRSVSYHELCPRTPMLFFNHYWGGLREDPAWPATKPLFLMPNIEMFELEATHYWQADTILCKTAVCFEYLTKWFDQYGNTKLTQVLYTRHTSSDVTLDRGEETSSDRLASAPSFVHTAGTSPYKGTNNVLGCWLHRPDLPMLHLYISDELYDRDFRKVYDKAIRQRKNIALHLGTLENAAFGQLITRTELFLCPSLMEGYGHYINQVRARGGLVLTPDAPPMNELITPSSGVVIPAERRGMRQQLLGGESTSAFALRNVSGFVAWFDAKGLCAAVDRTLNELSVNERHRRGQRARQQYYYDTAFFAMTMKNLRAKLVPAD